MATVAAWSGLWADLPGPCHPGSHLVLSRYLLLALARLALSCLAQARLRAGSDGASLLVRLHSSPRIVDLGARWAAGAGMVRLAAQALSSTPPAHISVDRTPAALSQLTYEDEMCPCHSDAGGIPCLAPHTAGDSSLRSE